MPTTLQYMFTNYGVIKPETLTKHEQRFQNQQFNIMIPLVLTAYEEIKEIEELNHLGLAIQNS